MLSTPLLYLSQVLSRFFRHPMVRQFGMKFPGVYAFLQNRLNLRHFFGLPFTLIIFLITYNLLLLTQLSQKLVNSPGLKAIDTQISLAFYLLREPWLSKALYLFTQLGSYYGLFAVGCLACIVLIIKRKPYYLLGLIISILGSGLAVRITKAYFVRERPLEIAYYPEHSFSFPSGHATGGVALEGFICYLFMLEAKTMRGKLFWFLTGIVYNLLMGFSRIYLGVHFATDVVAGWLLGFCWLLFGVVIMEYAAMKKILPKLPGPTIKY